MANCRKHPWERASDVCRACAGTFCEGCLVFAHGPSKPPYCVPCALTAAGVRPRTTEVKPPSRFELRRRRKELAREAVAEGAPATLAEALGEPAAGGDVPAVDLGRIKR